MPDISPAPTLIPGWFPHLFVAAQARYRATGRYCVVAPGDVALPPAVTLDTFMLGYYNQKQAGTCWAHAGKQVAEVTLNSLGYKAFSACRRLIGWEGKQLEGGGNPSDGGTCTDALTSMTSQGVGIAHEELCPYTDDYRTLGSKPPQNVFDDAKHYHLVSPVEVNVNPSSADPFIEVKKLLAAGHISGGQTGGHAVGIGIWWPEAWGPDGSLIKGPGGGGSYGHALAIVGYALPGVVHQEEVFKIVNSWDAIYPPLDPTLAAKFDGWKEWGAGGKVPYFLVTRSGLLWVTQKGNAEFAGVTDADGIDKNIVVPQWDYQHYI